MGITDDLRRSVDEIGGVFAKSGDEVAARGSDELTFKPRTRDYFAGNFGRELGATGSNIADTGGKTTRTIFRSAGALGAVAVGGLTANELLKNERIREQARKNKEFGEQMDEIINNENLSPEQKEAMLNALINQYERNRPGQEDWLDELLAAVPFIDGSVGRAVAVSGLVVLVLMFMWRD